MSENHSPVAGASRQVSRTQFRQDTGGDLVARAINRWVAKLLSPENLGKTLERLVVAGDETGSWEAETAALRERVARAAATMKRLQAALEA